MQAEENNSYAGRGAFARCNGGFPLQVIVQIPLIAINSFMVVEGTIAGGWQQLFSVIGEPVIALSISVLG